MNKNSVILRINLRFGILFLLLLATQAWGQVGFGSGNVTRPLTIPMSKTTTVTVQWNLSGAFLVAPANPRVESVVSQFIALPGEYVVGSTSRRISQSVPPEVSPSSYDVTITENLVIPGSVTYQAYKHGATSIIIRRIFTDGESPSLTVSTSSIQISGSNTAELSLSRQELYFENGSVRPLINQDSTLHAITRLSYTGSGLLKGVWEIATPASTSGTPSYRILRTVRQYLPAGGDVQLRSPALSTQLPGRYLVRFRIEAPVSFNDLSLEYFVGRRPVSEPPVNMKLLEPAGGSVLRKAQAFRWQPVTQVQAYRLEVYEKGLRSAPELLSDSLTDSDKGEQSPEFLTGAPAAGALVPGDKVVMQLSALTESHLKSGHDYWWRVLAIGHNGKIISQSPARLIHVP